MRGLFHVVINPGNRGRNKSLANIVTAIDFLTIIQTLSPQHLHSPVFPVLGVRLCTRAYIFEIDTNQRLQASRAGCKSAAKSVGLLA